MYFVITNSDGDTHVEFMSADKLEGRLNNGDYGDTVIFLNSIPNIDTNMWPDNSMLIIRGEIAPPKAVETVLRFRAS